MRSVSSAARGRRGFVAHLTAHPGNEMHRGRDVPCKTAAPTRRLCAQDGGREHLAKASCSPGDKSRVVTWDMHPASATTRRALHQTCGWKESPGSRPAHPSHVTNARPRGRKRLPARASRLPRVSPNSGLAVRSRSFPGSLA